MLYRMPDDFVILYFATHFETLGLKLLKTRILDLRWELCNQGVECIHNSCKDVKNAFIGSECVKRGEDYSCLCNFYSLVLEILVEEFLKFSFFLHL